MFFCCAIGCTVSIAFFTMILISQSSRFSLILPESNISKFKILLTRRNSLSLLLTAIFNICSVSCGSSTKIPVAKISKAPLIAVKGVRTS